MRDFDGVTVSVFLLGIVFWVATFALILMGVFWGVVPLLETLSGKTIETAHVLWSMVAVLFLFNRPTVKAE